MLIDEARIVRARDFVQTIVESHERCGATHPMDPAWRANCVALDLLEFVLGKPETMFEQTIERLLETSQNEKGKVTDHVDVRH